MHHGNPKHKFQVIFGWFKVWHSAGGSIQGADWVMLTFRYLRNLLQNNAKWNTEVNDTMNDRKNEESDPFRCNKPWSLRILCLFAVCCCLVIFKLTSQAAVWMLCVSLLQKVGNNVSSSTATMLALPKSHWAMGLEHFKEMVTWAKFITVRTGCDPKKRVGTPEMTWSDDDTCVISYLKSERGRKPEKNGRVESLQDDFSIEKGIFGFSEFKVQHVKSSGSFLRFQCQGHPPYQCWPQSLDCGHAVRGCLGNDAGVSGKGHRDLAND